MSKFIKFSQTSVKKNSSTCEVAEYLFNQPNIGIAKAKINGRYPTEQNRLLLEPGASPIGDGSTSSPRARLPNGARPEPVEGYEFQKRSDKKVVNNACDIIYFVLDGIGLLHTKNGDFELSKNDAVYLPRAEWYWVEGNSLDVLVISAPEWTVEQYQEI